VLLGVTEFASFTEGWSADCGTALLAWETENTGALVWGFFFAEEGCVLLTKGKCKYNSWCSSSAITVEAPTWGKAVMLTAVQTSSGVPATAQNRGDVYGVRMLQLQGLRRRLEESNCRKYC
jgi:hypothetical protein